MQSSDKNCSRCAELERELAEANRDVVNLHECLRQAALHEDAIPSSTRRNLAPCGCASLGQCVGAPVGCGRDYFAVSATLSKPLRLLLEAAHFELGHIHGYLEEKNIPLPITKPRILEVVGRIETYLKEHACNDIEQSRG